MKTSRVFILCAGDGARWRNYLGVPKQLISIEGETLLERTMRLLHAHNLTDIVIVTYDN
jgi:choline kinase